MGSFNGQSSVDGWMGGRPNPLYDTMTDFHVIPISFSYSSNSYIIGHGGGGGNVIIIINISGGGWASIKKFNKRMFIVRRPRNIFQGN